jgi:hypothetical protein
MAKSNYKLSFTTGGLFLTEAVIVLDEYSKTNNWDQAIEGIKSDNLLQSRSSSTAKRILHEVLSRLHTLTQQQQSLISDGYISDQKQLLWLAACKRYQILRQFGEEVIRNQYLQMQFTVQPNAFGKLLDDKVIWHSEIDEITDSTKARLGFNAFKMAREADILTNDGLIQPALLSRELVESISNDSNDNFAIFPISDSDIQQLLA